MAAASTDRGGRGFGGGLLDGIIGGIGGGGGGVGGNSAGLLLLFLGLGVVGGVAIVLVVLAVCKFCFHRRLLGNKRESQGAASDPLDGGEAAQEMHSLAGAAAPSEYRRGSGAEQREPLRSPQAAELSQEEAEQFQYSAEIASLRGADDRVLDDTEYCGNEAAAQFVSSARDVSSSTARISASPSSIEAAPLVRDQSRLGPKSGSVEGSQQRFSPLIRISSRNSEPHSEQLQLPPMPNQLLQPCQPQQHRGGRGGSFDARSTAGEATEDRGGQFLLSVEQQQPRRLSADSRQQRQQPHLPFYQQQSQSLLGPPGGRAVERRRSSSRAVALAAAAAAASAVSAAAAANHEDQQCSHSLEVVNALGSLEFCQDDRKAQSFDAVTEAATRMAQRFGGVLEMPPAAVQRAGAGEAAGSRCSSPSVARYNDTGSLEDVQERQLMLDEILVEDDSGGCGGCGGVGSGGSVVGDVGGGGSSSGDDRCNGGGGLRVRDPRQLWQLRSSIEDDLAATSSNWQQQQQQAGDRRAPFRVPTVSQEARRQQFRHQAFIRRSQKVNVSGETSLDSFETTTTDPEMEPSNSSRGQTTTSFESSTAESHADSTGDSQASRKLQQMQRDSGYKSLESHGVNAANLNSKLTLRPPQPPPPLPPQPPSPNRLRHPQQQQQPTAPPVSPVRKLQPPQPPASPKRLRSPALIVTTPNDFVVVENSEAAAVKMPACSQPRGASARRRKFSEDRRRGLLGDAGFDVGGVLGSGAADNETALSADPASKAAVFNRFFNYQRQPQPPPPHRQPAQRRSGSSDRANGGQLQRDFSIDERTNAIFNEFLRTDDCDVEDARKASRQQQHHRSRQQQQRPLSPHSRLKRFETDHTDYRRPSGDFGGESGGGSGGGGDGGWAVNDRGGGGGGAGPQSSGGALGQRSRSYNEYYCVPAPRQQSQPPPQQRQAGPGGGRYLRFPQQQPQQPQQRQRQQQQQQQSSASSYLHVRRDVR